METTATVDHMALVLQHLHTTRLAPVEWSGGGGGGEGGGGGGGEVRWCCVAMVMSLPEAISEEELSK